MIQLPIPTFPDVPYGPAKRQRIDFYQARGHSPRPVVVSIHGGGLARESTRLCCAAALDGQTSPDFRDHHAFLIQTLRD